MNGHQFNIQQSFEYLKTNWVNTLIAFSILLIGFRIAKKLSNVIAKLSRRSRVDVRIQAALRKVIEYGIKLFTIVIFASMIGLPISTFVAIIGTLGLAIGLALKDSLSNVASGILILFSHPFAIGDYIEFDGRSGTVTDISIFYTTLRTIDHKKIIIPNNKITSNILVNFSAEPIRRISKQYTIDSNNDPEKIKKLIQEIINNHEDILPNEPNLVRMDDYGPGYIKFDVFVWVKRADVIRVSYDLTELIFDAFSKNNIRLVAPEQNLRVKYDAKTIK